MKFPKLKVQLNLENLYPHLFQNCPNSSQNGFHLDFPCTFTAILTPVT